MNNEKLMAKKNRMAFEFTKLKELDFDMNAETKPEGRRYVTPEGNAYPSVTTVLSSFNKKAIQEWRNRVGEDVANKISTQASSRGTRLHTMCEQYLLNELTLKRMSSAFPDAKDLFFKMKPKLDDNIGKVYSLEQALYSDELKLAGRVDCIAEWNGQLSVVDFKSAAKEKKEDWIENYFMQCTAYAMMFEERTGIPINQIVVAIAVTNGDSQIFVKQKDDYMSSLKHFIDEYYTTL